MAITIEHVITYSLTTIYSFWVLLGQLVLLVTLRQRYFRIKRRETPPPLLTNPDFGQHHSVILSTGIKMHYVTKGDPKGKIILFVHGFPECWFSWRDQLKYFGEKGGFLAVAPDLRGYGDTSKPVGVSNYDIDLIVSDLVHLMSELWKNREGRPKVHCLVGHDWGGFIVWRMTADYPDLVNKLIVMNAPHPRTFKKFMRSNLKQFFMSWYIFFFQCPYLPELSLTVDDIRMFNFLFRSKTLNGEEGKRATDEEVECYKYYFGKKGAMTGPINYYRANFTISNPKPFPEKIDTPTLVIWGRKDAYLSEELAQCEKYVTDFRLEYIDEGTHFVQFSHPNEVNELVHDFVK